jgi:cystathionine beta-synthase
MVSDYPRHSVVIECEGLEKTCTWKPNADRKTCPKTHTYEDRDHSIKIKDSILDCVGNTPMVRINNITKADGIECEILVKCEFLNPAGSVKDRIGRRMVLDAELSGRAKPGDVFVEPTSGNTGLGIAMAAACRGYKMIITMPEKMSVEK